MPDRRSGGRAGDRDTAPEWRACWPVGSHLRLRRLRAPELEDDVERPFHEVRPVDEFLLRFMEDAGPVLKPRRRLHVEGRDAAALPLPQLDRRLDELGVGLAELVRRSPVPLTAPPEVV